MQKGKGMPFDPMLFRQVLGRFATGVTVITTYKGEQKHGMTANAFSSVSLNPPLVLISVDKRADMHNLLLETDAFCVNILPEHRRAWSDWWAGKAPKGEDQFATMPHTVKVTGCPVLEGCLGYIDCKIWARYEGGDHTLFLGEVQEAAVNNDPNLKPLLFFSSNYRKLDNEPLS
jgi:flavin reductase (DIM6/NTAB) family NADH-FMN oxidoreductase RutF